MEQKKLIEEIIEFVNNVHFTRGVLTTYDRDLAQGVKEHIVEELTRVYKDGK